MFNRVVEYVKRLMGCEKKAHKAEDRAVNQASQESFPSSDPPSWTTGSKDKAE